MKVAEAISFGYESLSRAGLTAPLADAKYLLRAMTNRDATFLIAHPEYKLTEIERINYEDAIARRSTHMPVQHITGRQEFYGLEFTVTPDVLIPRPETEILVEYAINRLRLSESPPFYEIGVGSGCISVSVLYELINASAVAVDISTAAIRVATENARRHRVAERLDLRQSDIYAAFKGNLFDAVLTNPPYISEDEYGCLASEVRDHEPSIALTDHGDGLSVIREIITGAPPCIRSGGFLIIEIGQGQAERVRKMFANGNWPQIETLKDLQGIERAVVATRR